MNDLILTIVLLLQHIWNIRDRKADGWFLCDSFIPVITSLILYLLFVLKIGPMWMEDRKPFNLKTTFVVFNLLSVLANIVLNYMLWKAGWGIDYKIICEPQDASINERALKMARACWWFYISKYVDCTYTIFLVLLKKIHKITLQHVFHHSSMLLNGFLLIRYFPGGHITFACLVNTISHVILYLYYALVNLYPQASYRKKLSKIVFWINFMELFVICIYLMMPIVFQCTYSIASIAYTVIALLLYILLLIKAMMKSDKKVQDQNRLIILDISEIY